MAVNLGKVSYLYFVGKIRLPLQLISVFKISEFINLHAVAGEVQKRARYTLEVCSGNLKHVAFSAWDTYSPKL